MAHESLDALVAALADRLPERSDPETRVVIGVAGPPAAGKSTLAEALVERLRRDTPHGAALLPMDGFHLDNRVLDAKGLRSRKGAPATFDVAGLADLLERIRDRGREHYAPVFDRTRDIAIAGAQVIAPEDGLVVVEGNYLLLDEAPWSELAGTFDHTVMIEAPLPLLEERLVERWLAHDHTEDEARARAMDNDIPNARTVIEHSRAADLAYAPVT